MKIISNSLSNSRVLLFKDRQSLSCPICGISKTEYQGQGWGYICWECLSFLENRNRIDGEGYGTFDSIMTWIESQCYLLITKVIIPENFPIRERG